MNDIFQLIIDGTKYSNFDTFDLIISILHRVGGGSGNFFDDITRFLIGTSLTIFLVLFASSRKSSNYYEDTREKYLLQGFSFACARNMFMLICMLIIYATSVVVYNTDYGIIHIKQPTSTVIFLEAIYPPVEHMLHFLQVSFISMAFVMYLTKETVMHKYYVTSIYYTAFILYCYSAYNRFVTIDPFGTATLSKYGADPSDMIWHLTGILFLIWPSLVILKEKRNWLTKTVLLVFGLYFMYHFGKVLDILTNEVYEGLFFAPVRHTIDLALFPLFLYIYVKENQLRLEERTNAVSVLASQMETYVRGTVHELWSPVAGIEGIISVLIKQFSKIKLDNETVANLNRICPRGQICMKMNKKMATKIHDSITHISDVLETMADFGHTSDQSKLDYHNLEVHLRKSLKAIAFQDHLKKLPHGTVNLHPVEGSYRVLMAPSKFRQIIDNLIRNAVYAIVKNREYYEVKNMEPRIPEIDIILHCDLEYCYIDITDNGIGMSEYGLKMCFQKSYTSKGDDGSGLGLYFSKMYMEEFHGDITVKSIPTRGTVFTLTFPVSKRSIMGKENRKESRLECDDSCEVSRVCIPDIFGMRKGSISGSIVNRSRGGLGLLVDKPLTKGQKINITYGPGPSDGNVMWVKSRGNKWLVGVKLKDG